MYQSFFEQLIAIAGLQAILGYFRIYKVMRNLQFSYHIEFVNITNAALKLLLKNLTDLSCLISFKGLSEYWVPKPNRLIV